MGTSHARDTVWFYLCTPENMRQSGIYYSPLLRLLVWRDGELEAAYGEPTGLPLLEFVVAGEGLPLVTEDLLRDVLSFGRFGLTAGGVSAPPFVEPPVFTCCLHFARRFLNQT